MEKSRLAGLIRLPPDVIRYLLAWMGPRRAAVLSGTCKQLYKLCTQDAVWKQFYVTEFGEDPTKEISVALTEWEKSSARSNSFLGKSFWKARYSESRRSFYRRSKSVPREVAFAAVPYDQFRTESARIVVLGSGGAGKSCLVNQFVKNYFIPDYDPTIEDSFRKVTTFGKSTHLLDILDTAGLEDYCVLRKAWLMQGEGFLVVFDVTSSDSFREAETFLSRDLIEATRSPADFPVVLVAAKIDLKDKRKVSTVEGETLANKYQIPYIETSAKVCINVDEVFEMVTQLIGAHRVLRSGEHFQKQKAKEKCNIM